MWLQACVYVLGGLGDWSQDFAYRRLVLFPWAISLAICFVLVFKSEAPIGDLHVSVCRVLKLQGWTVCQHFQILRGPSSVQSVFRPGWFCTLVTSCSLAIECDNIQDVTVVPGFHHLPQLHLTLYLPCSCTRYCSWWTSVSKQTHFCGFQL